MRLFSLPLPEILLRVGVAFAFLYPPIAALFDPLSWISYFPAFLTDFVGEHTILLLHAFSAVEVVLALWILFGKRVLWPATIAALLLIAIVIANPIQLDVLFRDLSIALASAALAALHRKNHG